MDVDGGCANDHDNANDANDDEDRSLDPALLEGSSSCVLDHRALAHWSSQRGKVCAAAVVAGALNGISLGEVTVTIEDALCEFQVAWQGQIGVVQAAVAAGIDDQDRGVLDTLLSRLLGSDGDDDGDSRLRAALCELSSEPSLREKLALLARLTASHAKLSTADRARASTACVGVAQLLSALVNIARARGLSSIEADVVLDRERLQTGGPDGAWCRLWEAFAPGKEGGDKDPSPRVAILILHLPRHYALVFGLREHGGTGEAGPGLLVREVLTARRKQKPREWVDFDQCIVPLMEGPNGGRCHFILVRRCSGGNEGFG